MRASALIMLACVTLACADVKPQKDFNISRVRLSHTQTRVGKTRTHVLECVQVWFLFNFPGKCWHIYRGEKQESL